MNHAGRHDNRIAFGDFATGRLQSKPRPTGKQPYDFVAGMEMWPETPGTLNALDDFQRPSTSLVDREERSGCTRRPVQGLISCGTRQHSVNFDTKAPGCGPWGSLFQWRFCSRNHADNLIEYLKTL
jgi:hypothetical protein